jgi:WD40 repeat protein
MGDIDGHIRIWDLAQPERPPRELTGHFGVVSRVAFDPRGEELVSAGRDKTIRRWDLASGAGTIVHRAESAVYSLALAGDGAFAAGFVDGGVRSWGPDGALRFERRSVHQAQVRDLAFTPDGATLVSAGLDGVVEFTDAATGAPSATVSRLLQEGPCDDDCGPVAELAGHVQGAYAVAIGPDGGILATGAGDGTIRLWRRALASQRTIRTRQQSGLTSVAFRAGDLAATGAQDGSVALSRLREGVIRPAIEPHQEEVWGLAFSPDRRYLAASGGKLAVRVWALDALAPGAGRPRATLQLEHSEHQAWIWSADFSPDSRLLATSDEQGAVELWDVRERRRLPPLKARGSALSVAFARRGETLELAVGGKDGTIGIWAPEDGRLLHTLAGHQGPVVDLEFGPGGDRLAAAGLDGAVRVWARRGAAGWQQRPELVLREGEAVGVRAVAFSGDGASLASGDLQGEVRVWDAAAGHLRFGLSAHRGAVLGLAFEDGWLLSGGEDRTVRRWQIELIEPLEKAYELACSVANRNLDRTEWRDFFGDRVYRASCPDRAAPPTPAEGAGQRTAS